MLTKPIRFMLVDEQKTTNSIATSLLWTRISLDSVNEIKCLECLIKDQISDKNSCLGFGF